MAAHQPQRPYQPYKEALLGWGFVSFFNGAPRAARRARVCTCLRMLSVCCLNVRRTVVAMSFDSGADPGG